MAIEPEERLSFFEIFNIRCNNADLGPISLNWFEELTAEALPYNPQTSEESKYKSDWSNKDVFKTPMRVPQTCSQLASTPRIFKDLPLTSPPFSSPIKELSESRSEAGDEKLDGKTQVISPCFTRTKPDLPAGIFCSFNSSLNESPAALREMYRTPHHDRSLDRTPQHYMKSDMPGSLFCTPKFLSTATPKWISESLGAEVDPEMSWSSSLATPPTLAATVIIAKGNDQLGERSLDNRTAYVVNSLFSKRKESAEKNDIAIPSKTERENLNVECGMEKQEIAKDVENVFCEIDLFESGLSCAASLAWKQNIPNVLDDGDVHQTIADVPGGDEDLSLFFISDKPESLRKPPSDKATQESVSVSQQDNKDVCSKKMETQFDLSVKNVSKKNAPENFIQNGTTERKPNQDYIQSSLTSEWSQLNLSGLDITQVEEIPRCNPPSINLCNRKTEKKLVTSNISNLEVFSKEETGLTKLIKLSNINTLVTEDETKSSQLRKNVTVKQLTQETSLSKNTTPVKKKISKMNLNFIDSAAKSLQKDYVCECDCTNCTLENYKISESNAVSNDSVPLSCTNDVHGGTCSRQAKDAMRSSLKGKHMLLSLKKQPKRFIYCVDDSSGDREETNFKGEWSSTSCALSHSKCKPYFSNIPSAKKCSQELSDDPTDSVHLCSDICTKENLEIQNINDLVRKDTFNEYNSFNDQTRYQERSREVKTIKKQEQLGENTSADSSQISTLVSEQKCIDLSNRIASTVKQKVLATTSHVAAKQFQMESNKKEILIHCPRRMLGLRSANPDSTNTTFQICTFADMGREILCHSSLASEYCNSLSNLHEISHEENQQQRLCCLKTEKEVDSFDSVANHLEQLLSGGCKEMSPCFEMLSCRSDSNFMLKTENTMYGNPISVESVIKQKNSFNKFSHNKNKFVSFQTDNIKSVLSTPPINKDKKMGDHIESDCLNDVISAKLSFIKQGSTMECLQTTFSVPQKESGSTSDQKVKLLSPLFENSWTFGKNQHVKSVTSFSSAYTASENVSFSSKANIRGVEEETANGKEDFYHLLSSDACSLNKNVGFEIASNKQTKLSENNIKKGKMKCKETEDRHVTSKEDEKTVNEKDSDFLPIFNVSLLNLHFDSFKAASNKQIQVSENNINKGELVKEIEDQYLMAFFQEETESKLSLTRPDNGLTHPAAENKLETNSSCCTELQISYAEHNLQSNVIANSTKELDSALQDLPVKHLTELSQSLTASQKAEITELSTILEETNSQFEFTQFRKKIVTNNVSELVEDLESTANLNNSEVWKEMDLDDSFNSEALITKDKCPERIGSNTCPEIQICRNEEVLSLENNKYEDAKVNVSHVGMSVVTLSKPMDTFLPENSLTHFVGFRSASGKKINVNGEVLLKAAKLFSDINDVEESYLESVSRSSNNTSALNCTFSSQSNPMCQIEKDNYCASSLTKQISKQHPSPKLIKETINQLPASNITENKINLDNEKKQFCISRGKDIMDSSSKHTININNDRSSKTHIIHKVGPRQSVNCQYLSPKYLSQFVPKNILSECGLPKDPVSSAACSTKVAKVKKNCSVSVSDEMPKDVELLRSHQNDSRAEHAKSLHVQPGFQTAAGRIITISTASLEKAFHLFEEEGSENKSNNSFSDELIDSLMKKNDTEISHVAMECNTNHNKVSAIKEKKIAQQRDHENRPIQENFPMGFHTASGKKVLITDESLAKVKGLLAEEAKVGINNQNTSEADDLMQVLKKDDENPNDIYDSVCKTFGKTSSKYFGDRPLCQGDGRKKHSVHEGSVKILKNHNGPIYHANDFETEHQVLLGAKSYTLDKVPKKNLEICKKSCVVPFTGFQTGKGVLIPVSESSLLKAKNLLNEDSLKFAPLNTDIMSKNASTEGVYVKPDLAIKFDGQSLKDHRGLANETVFSVSEKSNSTLDSYVNHVEYSEYNINCPTETVAAVYQNQSMDIGTVPKKRVSSSEEALESEISNINNLDMPSAENITASQTFVYTEGPLIAEKDKSNSKYPNIGPAVFSTAGGKTVSISHKALKQARQILSHEKSIDTNTETELQMNQTEVPESSKQSGISECLAQVQDKTAISSGCFATAKGQPICIDEYSLKYVRNVFADTFSEKVSKTEVQKVEHHTDKKHEFTIVRTMSHSDNFEKRPSFFSTASGKPVQLSDESVKKARQFFSEIESNHSPEEQQGVLAFDYQNKEVLQGNKENKFSGEGNVLINQKSEPQVPQDTNTSVVLGNSKSFLGFSTASGTQVILSESALQKVKIMFKEFDGTSNTDNRFQSTTCGTAAKVSNGGDRELEKEILTTKTKEMQQADISTNIECSRNMHLNKITKCVPCIKNRQLTATFEASTAFFTKNQVFDDNYRGIGRPETKNDLTSLNMQAALKVHCAAGAQIPENYLEKEAVESAKAFLEDDELMDTGSVCEKKRRHSFHSRTDDMTSRKRKRIEGASFEEPTIKRQLLPEFDRLMKNCPKLSMEPFLNTPDGTAKERRFVYNVPLKPLTCRPFSVSKGGREVRLPNFTDTDPASKGSHAKSDNLQNQINHQSSKSSSAFSCSFSKMTRTDIEKTRNLYTFNKYSKTFVPPFRTHSKPSVHVQYNSKMSKYVSLNEEQRDTISEQAARTAEPYLSVEEKEPLEESGISQRDINDTDKTEMIANLCCARDLQEMRIGKKFRQKICPQMGSLYEKKMSVTARIPLKVAVNGKHPNFYSREQLRNYGFVEHGVMVNSENAESFQFNCWDCFPKEFLQLGHGIQLADGGLLIHTNSGKAGKEELYRALCDTPGVDPKLITATWVYNHYRWIVWKLAAMEVSFPDVFASRCLTPERVLLQLKYRYDVEVDRSQRSAIKKITERDDLAAKTLILCVSRIISSDILSPACSNKINPETNKDMTIVEVTDGWYGINALLDPPLSDLLWRGRLVIGQKIIVHGAELIGSEAACPPLEIPESLMLKISANSTRPACWHAKLGFYRDPRPFLLPLSSLFGEGGIVGCVDVVIQRIYPMQWMEKMPNGLYVFRNDRAEEKEAEKHAIKQQKSLEALFAKIQTEFEQSEAAKTKKREGRRRTLTRQQIHALQDGADLYEAIQHESDPGFLETCLSESQLKALNNHRQMINDKKQAEIQAEFRKVIDSDEQGQNGCSKRNVTPVWKLRVVDYRKREKDKAFILSIWRPLLDVCSLLKEGGRFRIYHLATSQSKGKSDSANIQLTTTKKTQYQQLQPAPEILARIYSTRQILQFSNFTDPSFQPPCDEVDVVGYVVSISRKPGIAPFVYLCDENHNLMAIKFWMDLKQLAIDDIIKPCALISAINLQWRTESNSVIPIVFARDFSMISANPKESHLQEAFNRLRNSIQNIKSLCRDAECKLINLSRTNGPSVLKSSTNHTPTWKSGVVEGNKYWIPSPLTDPKHKKSTLNPEQKITVPPSSSRTTPQTYYSDEKEEDTPRNWKKRRALDYLGKIPSPAPVTPLHAFVSPSLQKAFRPPRKSCGGQQNTMQLKEKNCDSINIRPQECNTASADPDGGWVADEELAMINTQALLSSLAKDKTNSSVGESTSAQFSTSSNDPVEEKDDLPSTLNIRGSALGQTAEGTDTPQEQQNQSEDLVLGQKKIQRRRKRKY